MGECVCRGNCFIKSHGNNNCTRTITSSSGSLSVCNECLKKQCTKYINGIRCQNSSKGLICYQCHSKCSCTDPNRCQRLDHREGPCSAPSHNAGGGPCVPCGI